MGLAAASEGDDVKFVASMLCHNELSRFLPLAVEHLLTYVDEIRCVDDGSTDGSYEWLCEQDGVAVKRNSGPGFYHDESLLRNALLDWAFEGNATHVIAIDSDEFVPDGRKLRTYLGKGSLWSLTMREVWKADKGSLYTREDGGWRGHNAPIVYKTPEHRDGSWKIQSKKLASGRTPVAIMRNTRDAINTKLDILHFGWTREADRQDRYTRYAEHDRGRFHAMAHLRSILFEDQKVNLKPLPWPDSLPKDELLRRVT